LSLQIPIIARNAVSTAACWSASSQWAAAPASNTVDVDVLHHLDQYTKSEKLLEGTVEKYYTLAILLCRCASVQYDRRRCPASFGSIKVRNCVKELLTNIPE
jgi:hypothetical protein